jgi:hypothetical protein
MELFNLLSLENLEYFIHFLLIIITIYIGATTNSVNYFYIVLGFNALVIYLFKKYLNYRIELRTKKVINESDIEDISAFPSGKLIILSCSIKIYDNNKELKLLQYINFSNNRLVIPKNIHIKDENNFLMFSIEGSGHISLYEKIDNQFILKNYIYCPLTNNVFYFKNKFLISLSDNKMKIWEKSPKYQIKTILNEKLCYSILYNKKNNLLISSGFRGTKFWNIKKFNIIYEFTNIISAKEKDGLQNIDDDRFIVLTSIDKRNYINIISISKKQIVEIIKSYNINSIYCMKNTNYFFAAMDDCIYAYDKNNYTYQSNKTIKTDKKNVRFNKIIVINHEKIACLSQDNAVFIYEY